MAKQKKRQKLVSQYCGELAITEIHEGILAAQSNAERLLTDARLLFDAERHASAAALAVLSIEERGKVLILKRLCSTSDPNHLKDIWREYGDHRSKNSGWIIPHLVAEGARSMHAMAPALDADSEHVARLDTLKQLTTYTDISEKRHWVKPCEIANRELAESMIHTAKHMWLSQPISVRELELRREHLKGHEGKSSMALAIMAFQEACFPEGLTDTYPDELLDFMQGKWRAKESEITA